jgi:hypothetical protein
MNVSRTADIPNVRHALLPRGTVFFLGKIQERRYIACLY